MWIQYLEIMSRTTKISGVYQDKEFHLNIKNFTSFWVIRDKGLLLTTTSIEVNSSLNAET